MLVLYQSCKRNIFSRFSRGTGTVFENNCLSLNIDFSFQIDLLRKLKKHNGTPLTKNYRPPTPLNGRTVKASFNATSVATDTPPAHGSTAKPEPPKGGASVSRMTAGLFLSMLSVLFALQ